MSTLAMLLLMALSFVCGAVFGAIALLVIAAHANAEIADIP